MNRRLRIGVIFGGRSAEHEVSLVSAASVIRALDPNKYEVVPIGIGPDGRWLSAPNAVALLKERQSLETVPEEVILPDPRKGGLTAINGEGKANGSKALDVVFPVLHGMHGEDGTIQGLFELAGIPYVGAGVLGSAVGMDKIVQKQILKEEGILVAPFVWFRVSEYRAKPRSWITRIEKELRYPCFVKPANTGSSVGISKAHNRTELLGAIDAAATYDLKILVEGAILKAREIECSVLGNDLPEASVPGEVIPSNEFYDYDAKYVDGKSTVVIPAKLPAAAVKKIRSIAAAAFKALDCAGMARVDFLVQRNGARIVLNEINTIPGFTSISMYPKLWEASGLNMTALLDKLIELALERHADKASSKTTYDT